MVQNVRSLRSPPSWAVTLQDPAGVTWLEWEASSEPLLWGV